MKIHPVLIGIGNAILPGLGYLAIGERRVFGWLVLASMLLFIAAMFVDPVLWDTYFLSSTTLGQTLEGLSYALVALAFGYDAYDLARKKRIATTSTF